MNRGPRKPFIHKQARGVILFVGFLLSIGTAELAGAGKVDVRKGQSLYLQKCGHCHGWEGRGDGEMGAYLDPPCNDLTSEKTQAKSNAELKDVIIYGRKGTAMVGVFLDEDEFEDLLAYLRSLKR